jgi:hypothetical protein
MVSPFLPRMTKELDPEATFRGRGTGLNFEALRGSLPRLEIAVSYLDGSHEALRWPTATTQLKRLNSTG